MTDDNDDPPEADRVGYARPPKSTRFQPGRSGNPKGRPKGSKNVKRLFDEELAKSVTLTENGKRRRMPKRQALTKQLVNKALTNDPKATALVLDQMRRNEGEGGGVPLFDLRRLQDPDLLASIIRRIRLNQPSRTNPSADEENEL